MAQWNTYTYINGLIVLLNRKTQTKHTQNKNTNNYMKIQIVKSLNVFYFTTITKQVIQLNHARWQRCLCSGGLRLGGYRTTRRKQTCLT